MKLPEIDRVSIVTLLLIPLAYITVGTVLFLDYPIELKAMVIGAIVGKLIPDIVSYYYDSTAREAKKAEEQAKSPTPQVEVPAQTIDAIPPQA